ncbi:TlpA disulfide reductase family protein [Alkaliphilus hydrothermalis]|uniref:Thioredoxin family protein n=1 Tax=Alkaliphilus hydrothermalis TaxID=1482730 RepID=A0ABS2NTU1_9FIRM|nr:hypothetical protein [Alkaliphilus hydrothermalis]
MPGWQKFYEEHKDKNFEVLSIAVDINGADVVKPYANDFNFKTLIDSENILADHYGFKIVPNAIFINEEGKLSLIKQGFSIEQRAHREAIVKLLDNEVPCIELEDTYYIPSGSNGLEVKLAETKYKLAKEYLKNNLKEKALKELDEAILLDGDNFLIRKQRWYIRHPEKFEGDIDVEWQQQQLKNEKEEEAKIMNPENCSSNGCVIPGTTKA